MDLNQIYDLFGEVGVRQSCPLYHLTHIRKFDTAIPVDAGEHPMNQFIIGSDNGLRLDRYRDVARTNVNIRQTGYLGNTIEEKHDSHIGKHIRCCIQNTAVGPAPVY